MPYRETLTIKRDPDYTVRNADYKETLTIKRETLFTKREMPSMKRDAEYREVLDFIERDAHGTERHSD